MLHPIRTRASSHNPIFAARCSSLVFPATVPVSPCELRQYGLATNCDSFPKGPHCTSLTSFVSSCPKTPVQRCLGARIALSAALTSGHLECGCGFPSPVNGRREDY